MKVILEHRKQLGTSVLIIITGLPFKSALDTYLATPFDVLLTDLLLTFKPLINCMHTSSTAVFTVCVGTW